MVFQPLVQGMGPSAEEEAQFGFNSQPYTPPPPPPQQAQIAPSGAYAGFAAPVSAPQPVQQPAPAVQLQPQNIAPVQMQQPAPAVPGPSLLSRIGNAAIGGASMAIPGLSAVTTYPRVNAVNLGPVTPALEQVGNAVGDIGRAAFSSPLGPAIPGAVGPAVGMLQVAGGRGFAGDVGEFLGKSAVPTRLGDIILAAAPMAPEAGRLAGRAAEVASPFARGVAENPTLRRLALEEAGGIRVPGGAAEEPGAAVFRQPKVIMLDTGEVVPNPAYREPVPAPAAAAPSATGSGKYIPFGDALDLYKQSPEALSGRRTFIRFDPLDYQPGDKLPPSRVWKNDAPTMRSYKGTSVANPNIRYSSADLHGTYEGHPYLVEGQPIARGADAGEVILRDARVIRRLDAPAPAPETPPVGAAAPTPEAPAGAALRSRTPFDSPEIRQARAENTSLPSTHLINTPERQALRTRIADTLYGQGAAVKNREADIVLGPPAAGKSSALVRPLSQEHGSLVIDADDAKTMLPEYNGGRHAAVVHQESAGIVDGPVLQRALENGDNIVLPVVGRNAARIDAMGEALRARGYTVRLHVVDLPADQAAQRAIERFQVTGRFVDPEYVRRINGFPVETFDKLRGKDWVSSWTHYSNDVPRGQPPQLIAASEGAGRSVGGRGAANLTEAPSPGQATSTSNPPTDLERQLQASLEGKRPPKAAPVTVGQMRAELDAVGRNSGGTPSQVASRYRDMLAREKGGIGTPNENIRNAARDAYSKTLEATGDPAQAYQEARKAARIETQSNERTNSLIQDLQDFVRGEGGGVRLGGPEKAPRTSVPPPDKIADLGEVPKEGEGVLKKSLNELLGIAGLPQTLLSTGDMSNIYRQGGILGLRHPEAWKAMTEATIRSWGTEEAATKASAAIHESAWYNFLKNEGLKEYEYGAGVAAGERVPGYTGINESWMGKKLSGQWNVFGKDIPNPVRAAERAYATGLNVEGFKVAEDYLQGIWDIMHADPKGFNAAEFAKQAKGVIHNVNIARGYGTGRVADVMAGTHAFFSGRNLVSKPQLILAPLTQPGSLLQPSARRMAAENLATFITANLSWMGFMSAAGAAAGGAWSVEMDPRSTDWGKVKFGNTRIDLWNGFGPLVRLIAREATGETKNSKGEIQPTYRPAELLRFFQNKESPAANIIATKLLGQEPAPGSKPAGLNLQTLYNLGVPLLIQDAADALKNSGPVAAGIAGVTSFLGGGAQSYPPPSGERRDTKAQEMGLPDYASASKAQKKQINDELGIQSAPFYTANAKTVEDMDRFLKDAKSAGYGHAVAFNSLFRDVNPMDKQSMQAWNDSKTILDNYYQNHLSQFGVTHDALVASGWKQPARKSGKETETDAEYQQRIQDSELEAARKLAQKNNPVLDAWLNWWSKGQQKTVTDQAYEEVQRIIAKYGK